MYDPILGKNANRRSLAIANGNTKEGDGIKYAGRVYVQLTWKNNYSNFGKKLNIDLINEPDKALEPNIAAFIFFVGCAEGAFTGKKLSSYINENKVDYVNARRVVNGLDAAETIAGYARKFENCLINQQR